MIAKVFSCALVGLQAELIEVEVDIRRGLPRFYMVGLPDAAVRESRDRVMAAIKNSGQIFPPNKRVTCNLAPADLRKEGPAYDLPIAVGILAASRQVWPEGWRRRCLSVSCRWMGRCGPARVWCYMRRWRGGWVSSASTSRPKMRPRQRSSQR